MNRRRKLGPALLATTALLLAPLALASQSARHQAQELSRSKLSLIEAIIAAEKHDGGKATSAEFNFKRGNPAIYHVKVLSADGKKLTQYDIDPRSGDVKDTHNELLEKLVTRITPEQLRLTPTILSHAISIAQQQSGGRAISADVDRKGDHLEYTVETVLKDGAAHKVKVDGSDGKIISDDTEK